MCWNDAETIEALGITGAEEDLHNSAKALSKSDVEDWIRFDRADNSKLIR